MNYTDLIGRTLDAKYQIESELGRGGMGTVYLATHLGTERPVAIKVIAPQFMKRPEFVERFRREARAAGRLRHPNVVDVTDFGFAETDEGRVAYLVMEYLDGCTLGEILEEEKNLPISWTLDILEQVCSAVHEAHAQGIIHRDLKPDNIWLEPNQRGGYTVKVLDFGIAKLESSEGQEVGDLVPRHAGGATMVSGNSTVAIEPHDETMHDSVSPTMIGERATMALSADRVPGSDKETLIQAPAGADEGGTRALRARADGGGSQEAVKTILIPETDHGRGPSESNAARIDAATNSDLTRFGAVLGTPLYMSPEQCRGDKLDTRSDIYSIGVIAYQMLSGDTPFRGDFTKVMEAHKFIPPPPLAAKKVRKKLKRVILSSLAKDVNERPHSAEAFSNALRSRSEGIFGLLRRAGMIYTERIQKFLSLSAFFFLPMIVMTGVIVALNFLKATEVIPAVVADVGFGISGLGNFVLTAFCTFLILGTPEWFVTQSLAVPLRPIKLRAALKEARKKWKRFAGLGILSTLIPVIAGGLAFALVFGIMFGVFWSIFGMQDGVTVIVAAVMGGVAGAIGLFVMSVWLMLVAPVAMMEDVGGWTAMKRSKTLVSRSFMTALSAYVIMFLIPAIAAFTLQFVIMTTAKAFEVTRPTVEIRKIDETSAVEGGTETGAEGRKEVSYGFQLGGNRRAALAENPPDMKTRLVNTFLETLLQIFLLPIQIVVISFTSIIVALLYLKTRQAGGESLHELLANFEEADEPRKKWQERVRQRLIQSGRITSRS